MTTRSLSKFLILISCSATVFLSASAYSATALTNDLRSKASQELDAPARGPKKPRAKTLTTPDSKPPEPQRVYMQSALPPDARTNGRPKWTLEMGVENQRPFGELEMPSLDSLKLSEFESNPAVSATLGWWFGDALQPVWGDRWRSALSAQLGWSQYSYDIGLPGRSSPTAARLQILRPQLGTNVDYLVATSTSWNTEFWFGAEVAVGRLMQSQTSQTSVLLNQSLNKTYWEAGTHMRAVIDTHFLVSLQYRQRNFARQEGKTQHGIFALGLAL